MAIEVCVACVAMPLSCAEGVSERRPPRKGLLVKYWCWLDLFLATTWLQLQPSPTRRCLYGRQWVRNHAPGLSMRSAQLIDARHVVGVNLPVHTTLALTGAKGNLVQDNLRLAGSLTDTDAAAVPPPTLPDLHLVLLESLSAARGGALDSVAAGAYELLQPSLSPLRTYQVRPRVRKATSASM